MLQRAASNAYSWWWASHIRTKQSKWLETNLQDMEEKVGEMIKIIDDDGDSFAQRAEMYYRKRPELIYFVEDSYRSYRALAERYDHLSKELQSANRTIATVFPEQVQFAMDAEDEENQNASSPPNKAPAPAAAASMPKPNIPKVPMIPKKEFNSPSMRMAKKGLRRNSSSAKAAAAAPPKSGLNKNEALEEIDKLQKGILVLQTEKEFAKSSYERGYEKYWELENQITELQAKVCNLQDEFGIGTVIDDNEARTLMAATAVKSCQDTLHKLQERQEQSVEESKAEHQRIIEANKKFIKIRNRFIVKERDEQVQEQHREENENKTTTPGSEFKDELDRQGESNVELSSEKVKHQLVVDSNESITVTQMAEKIDELVDKVVNLEFAVSSQTALVMKLRSETDKLESHLSRLEGENESLIADSDDVKKRLTAVEEELRGIRSLNRSIEDQNNNLQTHFTEASCNVDYLSKKLQSGKIEEDVENAGLFPEVKAVSDAKEEKGVEKQASGAEKEEENNKAEGENIDSRSNDKPDEKKFMSETASVNLDSEQEELGMEDGDETPNWRMLSSGFEDREKILLEEYTSVLHNYKDVRRKLSEVEKKNRDGFIDLALQIRDLENAVAFRDEEIQVLRDKLGSQARTSLHETMDNHTIMTESHQDHEGSSHESMTQTTCTPVSYFSSLGSSQQQVPSSSENTYNDKERSGLAKYPDREHGKGDVKHVKIRNNFSPIEEKIRSDIDELLEENLEFWLRFSTSVHQIQKYQTTMHDLKAELAILKDKKQHEGNARQHSITSDTRPIYKHLREIQTELTLWLENNEILKDEVQGRYSLLCNIQDEIARVANNASARAEDAELSNYRAAKFLGEIMNMKQENKKIAAELHAGLDRVKQMRVEVEKTLAKLDEQLKNHTPARSSSSSRGRIPLQSFLFGVKLKKQSQKQKPSLFSCMNPALQRQHSDIATARQ